MLEIDGARYSGSGTIVRQSAALAALTGTAVRVINIRVMRPKPGLRRQHAQVVEAIRQLVDGSTEGVTVGSRQIVFRPGRPSRLQHYQWDIGSAGSTTDLALAVLPVLAFGPVPASLELRGGLFQDFAPSFYHLEHVMLPLLKRMGIQASVRMERPGYVPAGGGILQLAVGPVQRALQPLQLLGGGTIASIWGIALSSRLKERSVSDRMAGSAKRVFDSAGYAVRIDVRYDDTALQPGAGMAVFADLNDGSRLGSDRAGAPRRSSEAIGKYVARQLLEDLKTGAAIDRYASDQIIPFAALAGGQSRFRFPAVSQHIESSAWLSREFLGAEIKVEGHELIIKGIGFEARRC
jgi:RNA 3'-terminal phosphate cyclase (ATP)